MRDIIIIDDPEHVPPHGRIFENRVNMWCENDATGLPQVILTFEGEQPTRDTLARKLPELVVTDDSAESVIPKMIITPPQDSCMSRAMLLLLMAKLTRQEKWNLRFHE